MEEDSVHVLVLMSVGVTFFASLFLVVIMRVMSM